MSKAKKLLEYLSTAYHYNVTVKEGEEKKATFSKKFNQLTYWTSHNTSKSVDCDSLERAKKIVDLSGVEQTLEQRG